MELASYTQAAQKIWHVSCINCAVCTVPERQVQAESPVNLVTCHKPIILVLVLERCLRMWCRCDSME